MWLDDVSKEQKKKGKHLCVEEESVRFNLCQTNNKKREKKFDCGKLEVGRPKKEDGKRIQRQERK